MEGSTNYSHQSFDDMVLDLQNWVKNLEEVCETMENSTSQLEKNGYLGKIPYNVKSCFAYANRFYRTSITEINSILSDFDDEVQNNHVNRLRSLGETAQKLNKDIGLSWHREPWEDAKDYGNPNFQLVEKIYEEGRGMAVDMIDLRNLSARLEDFVGKRGNNNSENILKTKQKNLTFFIDESRLDELRAITHNDFELIKLVRLCEELNDCYCNKSFLATGMLGRAILDHVPPVFDCKNFSEVANNYTGGSRSFKQSMQNLDSSLRKISDSFLHTQIRKKEVLPNETQVYFANDMDVLLAEIVRLLK